MKKLFLMIAVIALVWSCQKSATVSNNQDDSNIESLKADELDPTATLELEVILSTSILEEINNNPTLGPVLKLWSKKSKCEKLGVCKWFPKPPTPAAFTLIGRKVSIPIVYNSTSGTFLPVTLAFTSSPSFLSANDIKFIIDEDFDLTVTSAMNLPFQTLRIEASTVNYDSNIGQFGGYTINIIGVY